MVIAQPRSRPQEPAGKYYRWGYALVDKFHLHPTALAALREKDGLSVRQLATRAGVSAAMISQIELGHTKWAGWKKTVQIAEALNVPVDAIVQELGHCCIPKEHFVPWAPIQMNRED